MSPSTPWSISGCSTSLSASPVSTAEKPGAVANRTTLDSFADASSTAAAGETAVSAIPPTENASPEATSLTSSGPQRVSAVERISERLARAPAGKPISPTLTSPSSAPSPPAWSACICVITTPSSARTPARASAALSTAGDGPVSISRVRPPSRTRIASPCSTSSISIVGPVLTLGPMPSSSVPTTRAPTSPSDRTRVGLGHAAHTHAIAPSASTKPSVAENPSGIAACGHDASHPAADTAMAPVAPAKPSTTAPSAGHTAEAASPASPARSTSETSGPHRMLAAGETSDSIWNVGTMIGSVATVAASVSEIGSASPRIGRGSAGSIHAVPSRASKTRPATAATDSRKPKSNELAGDTASTTAAAIASVEPPSARRPPIHAAAAAIAITHARTADGCTPENTTYAPTIAAIPALRGHRPRPTAVMSQPATAATTTRWLPDTATRCVSPVVRKSASAGVPVMRLRSPSNTPLSRSPPGPETAATRVTAHCLKGPIAPRTLCAQPSSVTRRARRLPVTPVRNERRPHSSVPGTLTEPRTSISRPTTGIVPLAGQSTVTSAPAHTGPTILPREFEPNLPWASSVSTSTSQVLEPARSNPSTCAFQCDQYSPPSTRPAESPSASSAGVAWRERARNTPTIARTAHPAAKYQTRPPSPARPAPQSTVSARAIPDQSATTSQASGGSDGRINARLETSLDTDGIS